MKRSDHGYVVSLLSLLSGVFVTQVQGTMPVVDISAIQSLSNQFHELQSQTNDLNAMTRIDQNIDNTTTSLLKDQEGHYGFGELYNSAKDVADKSYSPPTWDETLHDLSGGNNVRYQELVDQYQHDNPTISPNDYAKGTTSQDAMYHQQQSDITTASSVNATYAYNNIDDEISRVHDLTKQIDETENTKSAIDLNSRMSAELAYMQIESLKMQTIMNQQIAGQTQASLNDEELESTYRALPNA